MENKFLKLRKKKKKFLVQKYKDLLEKVLKNKILLCFFLFFFLILNDVLFFNK
jgi:hypothetical protein